ncbi:hypothetical protein [Citrobacter sp. Res13-Sevr-PEB04-36]|uniref:hypothetical protein n=1 Tax=Citrobacter sp. Res13-Sevr-PEB04-36 TaxID=2777960 RepID=UPI0018AC9F40|nr:hypothetical protein [Citrobacter sp. Res13-Sevr-PEB04-36]
MEQQQHNNTDMSINAINQTFINLYDTRYFHTLTHSRAILGEGMRWTQALKGYVQNITRTLIGKG